LGINSPGGSAIVLSHCLFGRRNCIFPIEQGAVIGGDNGCHRFCVIRSLMLQIQNVPLDIAKPDMSIWSDIFNVDIR